MRTLFFLSLLLAACGCKKSSSDGGDFSADDGGQGGSLARFAVVGSYLYTVDEQRLQAFDVSLAAAPKPVASTAIGVGIETIFPKDGYLFIGSRNGMYIYDLTNPAYPERLSRVEHVYSCDPVVANDGYAFVTLSSGNRTCWRTANELLVISIADKQAPALVARYGMDSPLGLGVDDTTLFVCDAGRLKVYGVADVLNIKLRHVFPFDADDVIPVHGLLMAVGSGGLRQYRYAAGTITLLSILPIN